MNGLFWTFAYIDPGTGSLVVQTLIAAGLAGLYFFKTKIRWLLGKLRRRGAEGRVDEDR